MNLQTLRNKQISKKILKPLNGYGAKLTEVGCVNREEVL